MLWSRVSCRGAEHELGRQVSLILRLRGNSRAVSEVKIGSFCCFSLFIYQPLYRREVINDNTVWYSSSV